MLAGKLGKKEWAAVHVAFTLQCFRVLDQVMRWSFLLPEYNDMYWQSLLGVCHIL